MDYCGVKLTFYQIIELRRNIELEHPLCIEYEGVVFKNVSFNHMLKCDGEIICTHWLFNNSIRRHGVNFDIPRMLNDFLILIGNTYTSMNCQSILQHGEWYVIDDGVQTRPLEEW